MAITKQQAAQELLRRRSAGIVKPAASSQIGKQAAIKELARRELVKRGQMQQKPAGFSGFVQNAGTDFGSFAKGILGLGRQAITHPVDTVQKVGGIGREILKGLPGAVQQFGHNVANFPEVQRKGLEAFSQLRQIPLAQQKEMLARDIQAIGESQQAKDNPDQRRLAQMGLGLLGHYTQYSRPGEKIYNEPFSFALDVLPTAKILGGGKLVKGATSLATKIPTVARGVEKVSDAFVPMGKLKRLGYGNVAEDITKTGSAMRNAQEGIIKSTVKKFDDTFKLSKTERGEFFDAIDSLRRTGGTPTSANPKVMKAIDWYMKEELPKIRKMAGYSDNVPKPNVESPLIQEARKGEVLYHGTNNAEGILKEGYNPKSRNFQGKRGEFGNSISLSPDEGFAKQYGKDVLQAKVNPKVKLFKNEGYQADGIFDRTPFHDRVEDFENAGLSTEKATQKAIDELKAQGYGGIETHYPSGKKEISVFDSKDVTFSKSQPLQEGVSAAGKQAPIQNYLHHFFQPSTETGFGGKLSTPQRGFLKQSKDVEGFVKDPVVSIAGVKSKAAVANIKEGFVNRITKKYARPADTVTEFKNGTILAKDTGEPLIKWKGQYLPKDLGEELLKYEGKSHTALDTLTAPLKAFNRNWKPLATAVRPRYHLRNVIGNVYNASFIGGAKLRRYPEAVFQQMKGHIATQMKEGTFAGGVYKALFKTAPEHKFIKMATEDGVIGKGFFGSDINDLADIAQTSEDFTKAIAKMQNPAEIYRIPVLRQWLQASSAVGQGFEDNARLALYIDQLKKGASRVAAKDYVNKHLFDYLNGLGEADKHLKAIIPFWSWTRFNVPLQYGAIAKMPVRHLIAQEFGKPWVQQQEQSNPEYPYLSQREKDMGAVKVGETTKGGKTYDKYMRTQGVLPIQDVAKVLDPENAGLTPLFDMLKQGYNMAFPPENPQQNLDYFGRPVEQFPGEVKNYLGVPIRGTGKEILQSIPAISELNKLIGGSYNDQNRPDLSSRLATVLSPTSQTIQDREKNRQYFESDYQRKFGTGTMQPGYLTELKYAAKNVIANPTDTVNAQNLKTLIDLMKQGGMNDTDIKTEVMKAIQAELKKTNPKEKKPGSLRPKRPSPLLDPYYANDVQQKVKRLNPFFIP